MLGTAPQAEPRGGSADPPDLGQEAGLPGVGVGAERSGPAPRARMLVYARSGRGAGSVMPPSSRPEGAIPPDGQPGPPQWGGWDWALPC